jgi:uncharacterized membrane protein YdjX (TVP38/TMEM64 family)
MKPLPKTNNLTRLLQKLVLILWLAITVAGVLAYFIWPASFTPQNIAELLTKFQSEMLFIYLLFSILRGFTLLPSTPLVIAGTLLFPQQPWLVLAVSIFGILVSSTMIYWFSDLLGISDFFEKRKPEHVRKIRARLEHPTGILFVFLWAFFPLVPTDAVCYVAGSTRMFFPKFIAAIFLGELILCCIYIFSGSYIMSASDLL